VLIAVFVRIIKIILVLVVFAFIASTVWQVASCEIANYELKDDLKDIASMGGARIGLAAQQSDDDLRATVIRKAAGHDIVLEAEQIAVKRSGTVEAPVVVLEVRYQRRVWVPRVAVVFRFAASSGGLSPALLRWCRGLVYRVVRDLGALASLRGTVEAAVPTWVLLVSAGLGASLASKFLLVGGSARFFGKVEG
jgi:hypothetical protein